MFFILFKIVLLLQVVLATVPAPQSGLWISTIDQPVACATSDIVYSGGEGPYTLVIVGTDYSSELFSLGEMAQAGTYSWSVNIQIDTAFAIRLTDCNGNTAYSAARVVVSGDGSCAAANMIAGSPKAGCQCQEPAPQPIVVPVPQPAPQPVTQPAPVVVPSPVVCVAPVPPPNDPPCTHDCAPPAPVSPPAPIEPAPCTDNCHPVEPTPCTENCGPAPQPEHPKDDCGENCNLDNQDAIIWERRKRSIVWRRDADLLEERDWVNPDPNPAGRPGPYNDPCNAAASKSIGVLSFGAAVVLVLALL